MDATTFHVLIATILKKYKILNFRNLINQYKLGIQNDELS